VNKNLKILFIALLALAVAVPAMAAATFEFHGDLNNRMKIYTDQQTWFGNDSGNQTLDDRDSPETFASTKYRMWMKASTNDGKVYGVYAIEFGGLRFGSSASDGKASGGGFSGDGVNIETRWAYTDFQLPSAANTARFRIGLQTHTVNKFFWAETAMGVKFYTDNWYLAWMRGRDVESSADASWGDNDLDTLSARYDMKMEPVKLGFFISYLWRDNDLSSVDVSGMGNFTGSGGTLDDYAINALPSDIKFDLLVFGVDGSWSTATNHGKFFINWDVMYEVGGVDDTTTDGGVTTQDLDLAAGLIHTDIGLNFGKTTVTYTLIYATGDDNPDDSDLDGWIAVDTDNFYSIFFGEGGYTDDDYFSERYYLGDKGIFMNKLALDYQVDKKLKLGIAGLYMLLAEDVELDNGDKNDELGIELQAYVSYKLYSNLELAWNIGYLASGDAMDIFESGPSTDVGNGSGDVDIIQSTARVRFSF
jgi:hypothetical protein